MTTRVSQPTINKTIERRVVKQNIRFSVTFNSSGMHQVTATRHKYQRPASEISVSDLPLPDRSTSEAASVTQQKILDFLEECPFTLPEDTVVFSSTTIVDSYEALKATHPSQDLAANARRQAAISQLAPLVEAYKAASLQSNFKGYAEACLNLGIVYLSLGYYTAALECFDDIVIQGSQAMPSNETSYYKGVANTGRGLAYHALGKIENAITCYELARDIFKARDEKKAVGSVYINLGNAYYALKKTEEAISCYKKALQIYQNKNDASGQAKAQYNLAAVYSAHKNIISSIFHYEAALPLYKKARDKRGEGATLYNLGVQEQKRENVILAIECYIKAVEIFREIEDIEGEKKALNSLCNARITQEEPQETVSRPGKDKIEECLEKIKTYEKSNNRLDMADTKMELGALYQAAGFQSLSESCYQDVIDIYLQIQRESAAHVNNESVQDSPFPSSEARKEF